MRLSIVVHIHILSETFTANPSKVFDELTESKEIVECADDITKYYNDLIETSMYYQLLGEGTHTVNGKKIKIDLI